ncbi:hypothetical protein Pdsh_09025 [Pyrodictium delaneyi]|uniref:ABC-2 type transporter transmembrane domain-containing protein n=2 Tax=Pyrodictium delaneyi TaxID=1273541 RepID=A0A211YM18_9CREN|nr:hypothetical protein Pdsh_09025 [Pyrodictium delaneyi]
MGEVMSGIRAIAAIVRRDILLDLRRRVEAGSMLVFSLAAGVLTAYVMKGVAGVNAAAASVSLVLVLIFLAVFGSLSSFVREADRGTLDGLRLAPVGAEVIFLAKFVYSFAVITMQALVFIMSLGFFAQIGVMFSPVVLMLIIVSSMYLAAVSSFTSAILVFSEARAVLMPVMVLVLVLPYVQSAAPSIVAALLGGNIGVLEVVWLVLAALAFTGVTVWLSRYILEAV